MKKYLLALGVIASLFGLQVVFAAVNPPALGGTGTGIVPTSGQTLIGNGSGTYTAAQLTQGSNIFITNASGSITIAVNGSSFLPSSTVYVATVNGQSGALTITSSTLGTATNTLSLFNGNGFTTTTIQSVLNKLSASGLLTYSSSTGVFSFTSSSLSLGSASQYSFSDFLPSSTVYVSSVNGSSGTVAITSSTLGVMPTTPAGSSSQIQFNNGGSFGANAALAFNPSTGLLVGTSTASTAFIMNFDTVLYVDQFTGSDIGAQANAADAALPSTGGRLVFPSGIYPYTTPIVATSSGKIVDLYCPSGGGASNNAVGGTVLDYTPSTGDAVTVNTNNYIVSGSGMDNCDIEGSNGTSARTTNGITLGGTNGAFSFVLNNVTIAGFGTGEHLYQNSSFITDIEPKIHFNGRDIYIEGTTGANGENFKVFGGTISDSNNQAGGPTENNCINNSLSGNTQVTFFGTSIDDCQYAANQSGGTSNVARFFGVHWEDPNGQAYDYITMTAGNLANTIISVGSDYMNDKTSSPNAEFVLNGGNFVSQEDTLEGNSNVAAPLTAFITNQDASDTVSWNGLTNGYPGHAAGTTNIVNSTPNSPQGYVIGFGVASYYMSATGTFVFAFNPVDANGNKYSTSTFSAPTGTPGYFPNYGTSGALATTSLLYYQSQTSTPNGSFLTPAFVQSTSTTQLNLTVTSTSMVFSNTTSTDMITVMSLFGNVGNSISINTVTDSQGNVYKAATIQVDNQNNNPHLEGQIWYAPNIHGSAADTVTVNYSTSATREWMAIFEYSNVAATNPIDASTTVLNNVATTTLNTDNITTTNGTDLMFTTFAMAASAHSCTMKGGYTQREPTGGDVGGLAQNYCVSDRNVTSTGTYNATGTLGATDDFSGFLIAFKAAPSSSPTITGFGAGTTQPSSTLQVLAIASSTIQIGASSTATGCLEMGAASGTIGKLVFVWFDSNAAINATTTKPSFCD